MKAHHPWTFCSAAIVFLVLGCKGESPTAPSTPPSVAKTDVVVWVRDASGACLEGAQVEVVDGTLAGSKQIQRSCEALSDGGGAYFALPTGVSVRLRALKPGFQFKDLVVVPQGGAMGVDVALEARTTEDVFVYVVNYNSSACLVGAEVEVLDGALAGTRKIQESCETRWDGGGVQILVPAGITVRLRGSKAGFRPKEVTVPSLPTAITIALTPE